MGMVGSDAVRVGIWQGEGLKYARKMHEGRYNLGPGSRAKQASAGVEVGRKYLDRAYDENRDAVDRQLAEIGAEVERAFA
jgi:hypothetical protein